MPVAMSKAPLPSRSTVALILVSLVERSTVACRFTCNWPCLLWSSLYQLDPSATIGATPIFAPLDLRAVHADIAKGSHDRSSHIPWSIRRPLARHHHPDRPQG